MEYWCTESAKLANKNTYKGISASWLSGREEILFERAYQSQDLIISAFASPSKSYDLVTRNHSINLDAQNANNASSKLRNHSHEGSLKTRS